MPDPESVRIRSKLTNRTSFDEYAHWFRHNEEAWEQGNYQDILTDEEIVEKVALAFPDSTSKIIYNVQYHRKDYRNGRMTEGRPQRCYKYIRFANGTVGRADDQDNVIVYSDRKVRGKSKYPKPEPSPNPSLNLRT